MSIKMSRMPALVPKSGKLFEEMEALFRTVEFMGDMVQCFDMRHAKQAENLLFRDLTCRTDESGPYEAGYVTALGIMEKVEGDISNLLKRNRENKDLRKLGSRTGLNQEELATLEFMRSYRMNLLSPESIHEFSMLMREAQVGSKGIKDDLNYTVNVLQVEGENERIIEEVTFTPPKNKSFYSLILDAVSELNRDIDAHNLSLEFENRVRSEIETKEIQQLRWTLALRNNEYPEGYRFERSHIHLDDSLTKWLKDNHSQKIKSETTIRMLRTQNQLELPRDQYNEGVRTCHFIISDSENGFQVAPAHFYTLGLLIYGIENRGIPDRCFDLNKADFTDENSLIKGKTTETKVDGLCLALIPTSVKRKHQEENMRMRTSLAKYSKKAT